MKQLGSLLIVYVCVVFIAVGSAAASESEDAGSQALSVETLTVLDLKTAGRIALKDNPSVQAAKARITAARERLQQARSGYWPRVDLTGSYSRVDMSDNDYNANIALNPLLENPDDYYNAGLRASWLLFDGFERKYSTDAAGYGADMSEEAYRDMNRRLLSSVANAYYAAQLARENIEIAKADRAFYQKQLDDAKARYNAGTGSLADSLNFEVRVNSAQVELIRANKVYEASMYGLASLIGIPDATFPDHLSLQKLEPEKPQELAPLDIRTQIDYALANRPDVLQNDYSVKMAASNVNNARSEFYPTLSLVGSIDGDRKGDSNFEQEDFGNTIALNLNYTLFAGGLNRAKLRESKASFIEAEKTNESLKLTVTSDVRNAVASLESARDQLALQRKNADLVQQNRDLVETEYAAGQSSLVRLNEAQRDLTTARSRLALALVSLRQSRFRLETETGRILEFFRE